MVTPAKTILILSANPKNTSRLRLDEERRDIEAGLERSRLRDQFRLITKVAARPRDVQRAMLDHTPQVVHFSGHGSGEPGIVLEDDTGNSKQVDAAALAALFALYADTLQCVVLNACYAEVQARAIVEHIPYAIGMNDSIQDRAAIAFAVAFYDALGAGRDIEFAYKNACVAIQMEGIAQADVPVIHRRTPAAPSPSFPTPQFSTYNPDTFAGRWTEISTLSQHLEDGGRILMITGMTGMGKTALGECLASHAWNRDAAFEWRSLEILEGQLPDFVSVAAELLAKLGDRQLDPQELNDPQRLLERLLGKLQHHPYWIQLDSLERLLQADPAGDTEFVDGYWITFLQRCLTVADFASRVVLTTQALPGAVAEFGDRYPNPWQIFTLQGLSASRKIDGQTDEQTNEHLALFAQKGVTVDAATAPNLQRIGQIYDGHPLVLQVIAKEILAAPFNGDVMAYWQRYGNEFDQVARETGSGNPALRNRALQKQVRRRVAKSLECLPSDALDLLCRSSVYRRPVPESFWLGLLGDRAPVQQIAAYGVLNDRALAEREGIHQTEFLIRQHNLIRDVAYEQLKANPTIWEAAERQAAHLWLNAYQPAADASNLDTVLGYLEAFDHYCEVGDWETADGIAWTPMKTPTQDDLGWQLGVWGYFREQILFYRKQLAMARNQGNQLGEGKALGNLGSAYLNLGQYEQAIDFYQQHLTTAREIGDRREEGNALGNLGIVYRSLGQYEQAIAFFQQALVISREIGNRRGEGNGLCNLGSAYYNLGQYEQAIDFYQPALVIGREIGDHQDEAAVLCNLGNVYYRLGQYEQALDFQQQHLTIAREIGNRLGEGKALGNLGTVYYNLGQYEQTIDVLQQRLTIAREIGDRLGEGIALGNLGNVHNTLGQYEQALDYYQQHLAIAREIGDRQGEGNALGNLGNAYNSLGQYEQAIDFHQQNLTIAREIGDRQGEGSALGNLGIAYKSLGQYEQAIDYYQQHLTIAREISDRQGEGIALVNLGETQLKLKAYSESLTNNRAALEIFQGIGAKAEEAEALKNLAKLHQALGEVEVAQQYAQQALALATELGIPLKAECEDLLEQLDQEKAGGENK